jgi:hypothetical protein
VGRLQSARRLLRQLHRLFHLQRAAGDLRPDRLTLVVGHRDEELPFVGLPDLVDRADVGVVQSGDRSGLPLEALFELGVQAPLGRQELEGHGTAQLGVDRLVEDPHPASAQQLDHLVVGDGATDQSVRIGRGSPGSRHLHVSSL